jgi:hypothetical protein
MQDASDSASIAMPSIAHPLAPSPFLARPQLLIRL